MSEYVVYSIYEPIADQPYGRITGRVVGTENYEQALAQGRNLVEGDGHPVGHYVDLSGLEAQIRPKETFTPVWADGELSGLPESAQITAHMEQSTIHWVQSGGRVRLSSDVPGPHELVISHPRYQEVRLTVEPPGVPAPADGYHIAYPGGVAKAERDYLAWLDAQVDRLRRQYVPEGQYMAEEYQLAARQADAFKARNYSGAPPRTVEAEMQVTGLSAREATDKILDVRDFYEVMLEETRLIRKTGKRDILAAGTPREKLAALEAARAQLETLVITPGSRPSDRRGAGGPV